jgi:tRNA (guanine37-N1)-methyltransferase
MRIDIITVLPELMESPLNTSILKRAQDKNLVEIHVHNLRDYSLNKQKSIDDYAFGGGAGMVMQIQPIADCIEKLQAERNYDEIIYMTPDGETLKQGLVNKLSLKENLIILASHYKGIDERVRELFITKEISIGDFVLTGGEIPAAILCDAIIRLIPGVINDETSALTDSFQDGLLAPPVYTRPEEYRGMKVPEILLGGNHAAIEKWREDKAIERTKKRRPDLFEDSTRTCTSFIKATTFFKDNFNGHSEDTNGQ